MKALIIWSPEHVSAGLIRALETTDPAWLLVNTERSAESWSLRCTFPVPPVIAGSPTPADVSFLMPDAPSHWLRAGARLAMFERATGRYATVEILGPHPKGAV